MHELLRQLLVSLLNLARLHEILSLEFEPLLPLLQLSDGVRVVALLPEGTPGQPREPACANNTAMNCYNGHRLSTAGV